MIRPRPKTAWLTYGTLLLLGVASAGAAFAAPRTQSRAEAIGVASRPSAPATVLGVPGTTLYDNTGQPADSFYVGQGGNEAIDDLHLTAGGSLDLLVFECIDPIAGGTYSATVTIYGNPSGLDLAASPLLGAYVVHGIPRGRQMVSVPLPDAPVVTAHAWVGVRFTSNTAGLVIKSVPTAGSTSHDLYVESPDFDSYLEFDGPSAANFAIRLVDLPYYGLTVTTVGSGAVTPSPDQASYVGGSTVQLDPTPAPNWHFVGWSGDAAGTDDPLSIVMDAAKSITATFAIDTYTLAYTAGTGGAVTGVVSQTVAHGANGTQVTAVANPGHHFVSWGDGVLAAARTELNVTANLSVTANFAINTYTLAYTAGPGGTIAGNASQTVDHGDDGLPVTATPNPGYHFVGWSDAFPTAARTDLNVTMNLAATATFAINTYTLAYAAGAGGTITGNASQTVAHGANGTQVTATPNAGHHFVSWSDGSLTAARTALNVTANLSVTATFAINTYTLAYTAGAGGTITGALSQAVNHGDDGTQVTAVPDVGFHFVRWSDGLLTAARTDLDVTASLSVTATFARDNLACNGDFELDLGGWAKYGSVDLTRVTPGYLSNWAMQIKSKSSSDCGVDDLPNCIQGTLLGNTYRFTAWVKAGSSSSRDRKIKLRIYEYDGSNQVGSYVSTELKLSTVWQKLSLDYVVRRSGTSLSERFVYDPDNSGEHFFLDEIGIELLPPPVRYTITAGAGPGGAIAPSGAVLVNQGDSRTFTITPSPGFVIQSVVVDASPVGAVPSYTFTNVQANRSIQASFAAIPPGLNLVLDPSFESGIQYWTKYGDATLSWKSGDARTGARSLQIAAGDGSFGCDDTPNWVPQVAGVGARYRFKAWVKAGNAASTGKVKIRVYELAGSSQVGSTVYSQEIPLTLGWQQLTAEHVVRQANTTLSMRVTDASGGQVFLVDDVSIELVSPPTIIASGGAGLEAAAVVEYARPTVFPSPARGRATLALSLARPGVLKAELYDVAGRLIRVLADEAEAAAGTHRFALAPDREAMAGAGIYFYRVEVGGVLYRGRFVILE